MASSTRIALVSDIHGNLHALERVFSDIQASGVDAIACLGDVATLGPRPREVLDLLGDHVRWFVLGNHDEYMKCPELTDSHNDLAVLASAVSWCRDHLRGRDRELIETFRDRVTVDLGTGAKIVLFHGTPRSNTEDLLADTPGERIDPWLEPDDAVLFAGGHTHVQMVRQYTGRLLVNPGSVGMPFRNVASAGPPTVMPYAEYAVVEARGREAAVTLRRVELDGAALRDQARAWKEPLGRFLDAQYAAA